MIKRQKGFNLIKTNRFLNSTTEDSIHRDLIKKKKII